MITQKSSSWIDQASQFIYGIVCYAWDFLDLIGDVLLELAAKPIEFLIEIFKLTFQILIFLRDLCIETMQTFSNLFQGITNLVSTVSCEDIEDFASACIVVLLWIGAIKVFLNMFTKNPAQIQCEDESEKSDSIYDEELVDNSYNSVEYPGKLQKRKKKLTR